MVSDTFRKTYRELSDAEKEHINTIKSMGADFLKLFDSLEQSREVSIAKTKLEEAVMWAVKAITK
jgi:hypothetical protein